MAQFFINRPVFAWVVSILIMVLGGLAITKLPVAQYPNVAPPSISVTANYAGASAETMQETVTSVIEQQLNGIDNLLYMASASDASGLTTVTLYFLPGTNPDTAQVQVQNKVQLATPSLPEFENILLRTNPDGSRVLLKDVARVALGAENYGTQARVNGHLSAAVAIKLSPTANALNTARAVREKVADLSRFFPPGVRVDYPLDTSTFVRISIEEVLKTLVEAIALVFLVMFLFLQNIRTTLIPTIVVPVALLGTF